MFRKIVLFCFFLLIFIPNEMIAGSIIGLEEAIQDSTNMNLSQRVDMALKMHPFFNAIPTHDQVIAKPRLDHNKSGIFLLSVLLLFVFSLARLVFPRYFANLFQVFSNIGLSKRHIKDQLENDNRASLWFYAIFYLSVGFIIYEFMVRSSVNTLSSKSYLNYLICTALVFLILNLRSALIRLIGWIFKRSDYVQIFLFNKKLANEFLGLILFPICILMLISSGKVQFGLLIIASCLCLILFIYGYIRSLPVLRNLIRVSFLHFLLYLCALEVIPVLILIKLIN